MGDGERELAGVRRFPSRQNLPQALLLQARATLDAGGSQARASELAREALDWLTAADLSPPAFSRLAERVADVGARAGDAALVDGARRLLEEKDRGRGLPSYERALVTIRACAAFERGNMISAARLANSARPGMFYGRSIGTIIMLEADALASLGESMRADSLYREVLTPNSFPDGDLETLRLLRRSAARACGACG